MNKAIPYQSRSQSPAFTLVELLVVVAMLGLFSLLVTPGLCRSRNQTTVTACAANFRQWAVSANMYAKDNRDALPSFNPAGAGMYGWDVGTNMADALVPYQLTVSYWFCPVRSNERDAANSWAINHLGHPILTIQNMRQYLSQSYPQDMIINHNYWVPRTQGSTSFPYDYSQMVYALKPVWIQRNPNPPDSAIYGWPTRLDDRASAHVPFVSDKCASGLGNSLNSPNGVVSFNVSNISPNTAHFFGGRLNGVNAAFVDGHVEMHGPSKIQAAWENSVPSYWFY